MTRGTGVKRDPKYLPSFEDLPSFEKGDVVVLKEDCNSFRMG